MILETKRLRLRQWKDEDYSAYSRLNADPKVMRYFPKVLSTHEINEQAEKFRLQIAEKGWGVWAVKLKANCEFIGMTGWLTQAGDSVILHSPLTEIAWRIMPTHWGKEGMRLKPQRG